MLTTAFALEGRVRPFNKWLRFELDREPPGGPEAATLLSDAEQILSSPTLPVLRTAFRRLEAAAWASGHSAIVDSWEPDVA